MIIDGKQYDDEIIDWYDGPWTFYIKKEDIFLSAVDGERDLWNMYKGIGNATELNLDLSKYYLIIFGSFWSHRSLDDLGIEYKSFGYIKDVSMLRHIYSAGDFFLAPAIQDGWPKTFGESLLCQTPVISFKNSAIGDVLTHNETGYIVENYDSNELSNMIKDLSKPSMDTSIVQKNGRNLILNHYSPSSIAKKYISLYKDIYK